MILANWRLNSHQVDDIIVKLSMRLANRDSESDFCPLSTAISQKATRPGDREHISLQGSRFSASYLLPTLT